MRFRNHSRRGRGPGPGPGVRGGGGGSRHWRRRRRRECEREREQLWPRGTTFGDPCFVRVGARKKAQRWHFVINFGPYGHIHTVEYPSSTASEKGPFFLFFFFFFFNFLSCGLGCVCLLCNCNGPCWRWCRAWASRRRLLPRTRPAARGGRAVRGVERRGRREAGAASSGSAPT